MDCAEDIIVIRHGRPAMVPGDGLLRRRLRRALIALLAIPAFILWATPRWHELMAGAGGDTTVAVSSHTLVIGYSLLAIIAVALISGGLSLARTGNRVLEFGRFPVPCMRLPRDVWVVRGSKACWIAFLLMSAGVLLILAGGITPLLMHAWLDGLIRPSG